MNIAQKRDNVIEARNRITEGIAILREVFNDSKDNWLDKKWGSDITIAMGYSQDICSRLDGAIFKLGKDLNSK